MNQKMVGVFHSHINTDEKFSEKDIKISEELMFPFWVYSSKTKKHNVYIPENLYNKKKTFDFIKFFFIYSFKHNGGIKISFKKLDNLIKSNNFKVDKHHDSWKKCWVIPFKDICESMQDL